MLQLENTQVERWNSPLFSLFVLFRPSVDWMGPAHIGEGSLLSSVFRFRC